MNFIEYSSINTWNIKSTNLQCVPKEWRIEQKERYNEVTKTLNKLADEMWIYYNKLIKQANAKFYK